MNVTIVLLLILIIALYWWHAFTAYEIAYAAAHRQCGLQGLQFLDDTLRTIRIRLCRHPNGYIQLCRDYHFEYSTDGDNRLTGVVRLEGKKVSTVITEDIVY